MSYENKQTDYFETYGLFISILIKGMKRDYQGMEFYVLLLKLFTADVSKSFFSFSVVGREPVCMD